MWGGSVEIYAFEVKENSEFYGPTIGCLSIHSGMNAKDVLQRVKDFAKELEEKLESTDVHKIAIDTNS